MQQVKVNTREDHDIDGMSYFCRRCGAAMLQIVEHGLPCTDAPNVVAVSHIISRRWFERLERPFL